jgi:demethylmenaquinone methyltransferase/2-methoxy-6-polyprenyl-1,4-benzoquinol methylase
MEEFQVATGGFYLKICLTLISRAFGSGSAALGCRGYFVDAIRMFYSVAELSSALSEVGFSDVVGRPVLAGAVGFHAARKLPSRARPCCASV